MACLTVIGGLAGRTETLISCTGLPGGDSYDRGFYIPNYPGNSLDSVRMEFSSADLGNYTVTLTVRGGAYDGTILAASTTSFSLAGADPQNQAVTFVFPSTRIAKGSRVCFALALGSSPGGHLFYSVPGFSGGCPDVVETENTAAPLSTFRRNGVNLVVTGQDTLIVAPGETIQAAINAASPGDTVAVDPGTYIEDLTLRSDVSVVGAGFNKTILRGSGTQSVVTAINVTNSQFEGFKITRSGSGSSHAGVDIRGGNVLFDNNWIIGNQNGIQIYNGSSSIVRNNVVEGNGDAGNGLLEYGIICLHATPLIANNVVVSNSGAGLYIGWADSSGAQVINNTVVDNTDEGIWCYSGANAVIKNNIFKGNSTGISASHGSLPQISFNNVWSNRWQNYDSQSGGLAAPGLGDISADPLFDSTASPPFVLLAGSACIDAGDPAPIYNDLDGSRNDMGAFGGSTGLLPGLVSPVTSGFLFNNIGKIPTSEISPSGAVAGLANVSPAVANALKIFPYHDAPFGGNLWLHGLFGLSDTAVRYYRVYAAKWTGGSPPSAADFHPLTDPLSKIKYTVGPSGTVTATLEPVGPDANGLYLRTDRPDSGYWAHPDLKLIWNTRGVENGRYDLICKGYWLFLGVPIEVALPANDLSRITVYVDNQGLTATINSVRDRFGNVIPECGLIPLLTDTEAVQFDITASHPGGFLRDYTLEALYGRNRYAGVIAEDHYTGSNDGTPPTWMGVTGLLASSVPAQTSGALAPWTTCAYQFRLVAWARTTDGFNHIYWKTFNDHYFINLGPALPTGCVADLDGDGDVDGQDLVIFGSQFGRTNCVSTPSLP
jgi:Right handed beta helix region